MPNDFYGVAWIFIMYAFVGWCCEVILPHCATANS